MDLTDESDSTVHLYTPAMMAQTLGISVRAIRLWCRTGIIQPVRVFLKIPYFDYAVLSTANTFAHWMRQGLTARSIAQQITSLGRLGGASPQAMVQTLPISLEGKRLVLQQNSIRLEASGQLQLSFDSESECADDEPVSIKFDNTFGNAQLLAGGPSVVTDSVATLTSLLDQAMDAEDREDLDQAARLYRDILASYGPSADVCFQLAEVLYRQADLGGARERYFSAVELDPGLVEARANLGCVLAEQGQADMAIAEFKRALELHPEYADVHFHLARTLDMQGLSSSAVEHWRKFVELAPASPWADEAVVRLAEQPGWTVDP